MKHTVCCLLALTAITAAATGETSSVTDERVARLAERVARLQAEVNQLRGSVGDEWLTEQRAEEIRSLVQDVLADADTRASLLESGLTAGWDGHPFIASADGAFELKLSGQLQVRFVWNNQEKGSSDSNRWGFENRRTKIKFAGHVFNDWKFKFNGAFGNNGDGFDLQDAYIQRKLGDALSIKIGQFRAPFMREELVSSSRQLGVDRSLVNERFNQDRSQGVQLAYKANQFRLMAMYHDGLKSKNTEWQLEDTEYALTGRVEFLAMGDWKQFKDFSSKPGSEPGLLIGLAGHYEKEEYGVSGGGPKEEDARLTADVSFEGDGFNVFGAFVYQDLKQADVSPWGWVVQGGYYLTDKTEIFGRYECGDSDDSSEKLSVLTAGVNHYFNKNVKWTTDLGYGFHEVTGAWDKADVSWREDASGDDGQIVFRTQLQLVF